MGVAEYERKGEIKMLLESLRERIQWLKQQLNELFDRKRREEAERDSFAAASDLFRKLYKEKQDEIKSLYQSLVSGANEIQGTRFKREYLEKMKKTLQGAKAAEAFRLLEESVSNATNGHQQAEDRIADLTRRIRSVEDELVSTNAQFVQQQEEEKNGGI